MYRVCRVGEKGFLFMFTPRMNSSGEVVDVKVIEEKDFLYWDTNFNQPSIYYVVDPGKTKEFNCNLDDDFHGKVVIVASPDNRHWGESDFLKYRGKTKGLFMFLPVWTLNELLYAKQYFEYSIDDDEEIMRRYEKMGGIPRHIFTDNVTFLGILESQKAALNSLNEDQLRKLTANDINSAQTSDKDQPKSLLMVYEGSNDNSFRTVNVAVSSKFVLSKLIEKNADFMWKLMISLSVEYGGYGWKIFESYCQERLLGAPKEYFDCKYHNGTDLVPMQNTLSLKLGGCSAIKGTRENLITAASKNKDQTLFYSLDPNHVFIDFIYKKEDTFYAFQVILADHHTCNSTYLLKYANEAGGPTKFVMHYLCYGTKYSKFKLKPKNPLANLPGHGWTINVVFIPRPDDEHKGPSKLLSSIN